MVVEIRRFLPINFGLNLLTAVGVLLLTLALAQITHQPCSPILLATEAGLILLLNEIRSLLGRETGKSKQRELLTHPIISSTVQSHTGQQELSQLQSQDYLSEQNILQEALQEAHQTLQALVNACPLGVTLFTLDGTVKLWNPAAEKIFGWQASETIGEFLPSIPDAKRDEFLANLELIRQGHALFDIEARRQNKAGEFIDVKLWAAPVQDGKGNVSCMSIVADVAELKQIEAERQRLLVREQAIQAESKQNREQLFKTLESITDGFMALDTKGQFTYVNAEGARTLRYAPTELLGKNIWEEMPDLRPTVFGQLYEQAIAENVSSENVSSENVPLESEGYCLPLEGWFAVRVYPSASGLTIYFRNITDRKQTEETLRQSEERLRGALYNEQVARVLAERACKEAEAANRLKDEFLTTLSHELRTPLGLMLGWTQMLKQRRLNAVNTARALETIDRNARSLSRLIEDLLDVSRIITHNLRLNLRPVEISSVVAAAIAAVQPSAAAKNIDLKWHFDRCDGIVMGDSDRLQQVVWNLLVNAVKFTPDGGQIRVRLEPDGVDQDQQKPEDAVLSTMQIVVSDTGKGITPDFLPFVFDHFRQADGSLTRPQGGLGLGMAIVHHLVELHGGTVTAISAGEGQGATFTVKLPFVCKTSLGPAWSKSDQIFRQPQAIHQLQDH